MIIVNFSHELTPEQQQTIATMTGKRIERIIDVAAHFEEDPDFGPQVRHMVDTMVPLSRREWDTEDIYIRLPSYSPIVAVLLAYVHGLSGHFPQIIRVKQREEGGFAVQEIINLEGIRANGRKARYE